MNSFSKALAAECLGTFWLVLGGCGSAVLAAAFPGLGIGFTGVALAAQDAGLEVLGYTSQARFLFNCGLLDLMAGADLKTKTMALKLVDEHEMGELFKVIALGAPGLDLDPIGFTEGDRTHRL